MRNIYTRTHTHTQQNVNQCTQGGRHMGNRLNSQISNTKERCLKAACAFFCILYIFYGKNDYVSNGIKRIKGNENKVHTKGQTCVLNNLFLI